MHVFSKFIQNLWLEVIYVIMLHDVIILFKIVIIINPNYIPPFPYPPT
jgi:hypothetical protein